MDWILNMGSERGVDFDGAGPLKFHSEAYLYAGPIGDIAESLVGRATAEGESGFGSKGRESLLASTESDPGYSDAKITGPSFQWAGSYIPDQGSNGQTGNNFHAPSPDPIGFGVRVGPAGSRSPPQSDGTNTEFAEGYSLPRASAASPNNLTEEEVDGRVDVLSPAASAEFAAALRQYKDGSFSKLQGGLQDLGLLGAATLDGDNGGLVARGPFKIGALNSLPLSEDYVVIDAVFDASDVSGLMSALEGLGLSGGSVFGNVISGLLPVSALGGLADLDGLQFVRPSYALSNVGQTTSQADTAMNADAARAAFGVDGSGITIGVLSDSYNNLGGAFSDIASDDLPASGVNVLADLSSGGTDEGRAMLQLIHDVAPGASLAFHTAFNGQADFAQGIVDLANAGADAIVDDVVYLNEPFFQDGIIAQAVDQVVAQGIPYFSSAGNSARNSYESAFRPSNWLLANEILHDFGGGDPLQSITIQPFSLFSISLQWDQPFASTLAPGSPGSASDIDLFILDAFATSVLFQSADFNIGADPVEVLQLINTGPLPVDVNLAIGHFAGPVPGLMKYVIFGGGTINEYATNSATTIGHANAEGAIAVGASFYAETPAFGTDPALLEPFSSAGGTPILFDAAGTRLASPIIRETVDIVAPDGTNTTFFGTDVDGDGFPNFFGTSAAAPHAAAVAALMLEAAPGSSVAEIYAGLTTTTLDMDDPEIIYAGTGKTSSFYNQGGEAIGVLKSGDAGPYPRRSSQSNGIRQYQRISR